ncbi:MAG: helix-turn-helix transcriptional regulator [Chitinispirillaceae bacterium]
MKAQCISEYLFSDLNSGDIQFTLSGHSMHPTIKNNQVISVQCLSLNIKVGKIYVFLYDNRLICHRLVKKFNNRAVLCGDNCFHTEEVPVNSIIGVYPKPEPILASFIVHLCNILLIRTKLYFFLRAKRFMTRKAHRYEETI